MRQMRPRMRVILVSLVAVLATGAVTAEVDTSFDAPEERPENPALALQLPDPDLPGSRIASTSSSDATSSSDTADTIPSTTLHFFDPGSPQAIGPRPDTSRVVPPADEPAPATPAAARPAPAPPTIDSDPQEPRDPAVVARELGVDARWPAAARTPGGVVADAQVIAYYGHPMSRLMGILGESAIEEMAEQLKSRAAEYDAINGEIGVAPAFHLIYGTVYEDASVGILREHKLIEYITFAREHDLLVFLDHQIGNGTVEGAIRMMLPYLRYDNVHLAIDPEWATEMPGKEIGGVTAEEINRAQQLMQDYLVEHDLPGARMLVVHQFNWRMIENRERVRTDFPRVQLIHNADGFGAPPHKRDSWRFNVLATNMPLKGFKLFYPKSWRDGGYDDPLMSPEEVMQLEPVPVYIQYQ